VIDPEEITEGTTEAPEEMLSPRVDVSSIAGETDDEKLNGVAFELYKEALSVVNLAAHALDEASAAKGGDSHWICFLHYQACHNTRARFLALGLRCEMEELGELVCPEHFSRH
jgi:hypothetical protein